MKREACSAEGEAGEQEMSELRSLNTSGGGTVAW